MARKLALIPKEEASLPIYLFSYLQNLLLVKVNSSIPKNELNDGFIDPTTLDTYDILQRSRYCNICIKHRNFFESTSIAKRYNIYSYELFKKKLSIQYLIFFKRIEKSNYIHCFWKYEGKFFKYLSIIEA